MSGLDRPRRPLPQGPWETRPDHADHGIDTPATPPWGAHRATVADVSAPGTLGASRTPGRGPIAADEVSGAGRRGAGGLSGIAPHTGGTGYGDAAGGAAASALGRETATTGEEERRRPGDGPGATATAPAGGIRPAGPGDAASAGDAGDAGPGGGSRPGAGRGEAARRGEGTSATNTGPAAPEGGTPVEGSWPAGRGGTVSAGVAWPAAAIETVSADGSPPAAAGRGEAACAAHGGSAGRGAGASAEGFRPAGQGGAASAGDAGRAGRGAAVSGGDVRLAGPGRAVAAADTRPAARGPWPARAAARTAADPVKSLMHRHRALCERAVDPLEIAAGLEAHGVTDRTAARFRHRDVFSLAEEMYARVPRDTDTPEPVTEAPDMPSAARWIALGLLPGVLCAATVAALRLTEGRVQVVAAAVGALAVAVALGAVLRRGPLRAEAHAPVGRTCWLLAYAVFGDGLLHAALGGGPDGPPDGTATGPWGITTAPLLALALSCAPAVGTAHVLATRARCKLATSRGLADFTTALRPLLLGLVALFLVVLAALLTLTGTVLDEPHGLPQGLTLGALLLLARLLTVHGFAHAPSLVLTAVAAAEATALASVFAGRLPGWDVAALPVESLVGLWGPAAVPTSACGLGALVLLVHATRRLTRASAHAPADRPR